MKYTAKALGILIDSRGKTIGARLLYKGKHDAFDASTSYLLEHKNDIELENATIDSNGHVRSKRGYADLSKISIIILYHGSKTGIIGDIRCDVSKKSSDFGSGFYTANNVDYALSILVDKKNDKGYCYKLFSDLKDLRIYDFNNDLELWALYTAYNRGRIDDIELYPKLRDKISNIETYDMIYGLIADDRSAYAFQRFMSGSMTDRCLFECLKHFDLGYQYVFKTEASCKKLQIVEWKYIEGQEYNIAYHNKQVRLNDTVNIVQEIEKKYRRDGRYIDEVLEVYK